MILEKIGYHKHGEDTFPHMSRVVPSSKTKTILGDIYYPRNRKSVFWFPAKKVGISARVNRKGLFFM